MGKPELKSPRFKHAKARAPIKARANNVSRSSANIKVVVRVRPPNHKEQGDNQRQVIKIVNDQILIFDPKLATSAFFYHGVEQQGRDMLRKPHKDIQFVFDRVFGFEASNDEIFENTTKDLIGSLMDGYNCSVFAYGATGAGKTFTMIGTDDNPGITFLTMAELFKAKDNLSAERSFELGISYIEVYNELVQDLLNPGAPLQLRDDGKYGVMVAGIKIHKIEGPDELFDLLAKGNSNRTQHPTDANAESSRSHAVFQVYLQMEMKATREVRAAKLSMIDLAGSERGSATGYGGARFAEGANINKSLLALGNCINSLAGGQKYVPYRDSKLTRLLKDSLGGNCKTVMIANVSPSSLSFDDTHNTLKYAIRAKSIKSDSKMNVVNVELYAGEYSKIIEELRKELERVKAMKQNEQKSVDGRVLEEFNGIIAERKSVLEKIYRIESSEKIVMWRKNLKEDVDSRLSGFCLDKDEQAEAHWRLGNSVGRFCRQEASLQSELTQLKLKKLELEDKTVAMLGKHPELKEHEEKEKETLARIEAEYQHELEQKKSSMINEELKYRTDLLDKACLMLRSAQLQLRGHGLISQEFQQKYQLFSNQLKEKRTVTWDSPLDSGLSSTSSVTDVEVLKPSNRQNDENGLDNTFVLPSPKQVAKATTKVKLCAEEMMVKVYSKSPPNVKRKLPLGGMRHKRPISTTRTTPNSDRKKPMSKPGLKDRPAFRT